VTEKLAETEKLRRIYRFWPKLGRNGTRTRGLDCIRVRAPEKMRGRPVLKGAAEGNSSSKPTPLRRFHSLRRRLTRIPASNRAGRSHPSTLLSGVMATCGGGVGRGAGLGSGDSPPRPPCSAPRRSGGNGRGRRARASAAPAGGPTGGSRP
jgi:hypothetical protein